MISPLLILKISKLLMEGSIEQGLKYLIKNLITGLKKKLSRSIIQTQVKYRKIKAKGLNPFIISRHPYKI